MRQYRYDGTNLSFLFSKVPSLQNLVHMLVDRLRTSAILISVVVVLIYLDSTKSAIGAEGLWLLPLLLFFSLGTAWDLCGLVLESGRALSRRFTLITTAIITLSAAVPMLWTLSNSPYPGDCPVGRVGWIAIGTITAVLLTFGLEMWTYGKPEIKREKGASIDRTLSGVFVSVYVGLPMALFVSLRGMGTGNWGLAALITMIAVTKSSDAGAYFSGRALGKRKLIPRLSPGKTWEGAIGGIIASTIVAFACLLWLFPGNSRQPPKHGGATMFCWRFGPWPRPGYCRNVGRSIRIPRKKGCWSKRQRRFAAWFRWGLGCYRLAYCSDYASFPVFRCRRGRPSSLKKAFRLWASFSCNTSSRLAYNCD